MYIKHWAAPPFDLQRIQTTSEHAVLEFVLVVSLFGHKCKRKKKKENPRTQKKKINKIHQHQKWKHWSDADTLSYSSSQKESKKMKAPICLNPLPS